MGARQRSRARMAGAVLIALVAVALAAPGGAASRAEASAAQRGGQPRPFLAYAAGNKVVVIDRKGTTISQVRRGNGGFSLAGGLLAKGYDTTKGARTVGFDARTGDALFGIRNTLLIPTALERKGKVAFLGQGHRDPYATSLWLRNRFGVERKLIQFSFGGSPGVHTGISEGGVLDYSFDDTTDVAAVVAGNDYADFTYDIWAVDVRSREHVRLTKGQHSRYPAVSRSGGMVAYFREEKVCGGPMPGWRSGDLMLVEPDGTGRRRLEDGSCTQYLTRPRWLDDSTVVAVLHIRRAGSDPDPLYDSQLVLVDVATGAVSPAFSKTDRVGEVSVSAYQRRIAYTDWTQPEGFWVYHSTPGPGAPADPAAWTEGHTRRFDVGNVPHLDRDPTLIPSY